MYKRQVLARRLISPLRQLNEGARDIAAGKLDCQLPVRGNDEIAELTAGFNVMARQLEIMRHESIKSARQERSRMLGEIALGFAHEIRNPLVVIKTSAEVVLASLAVKSREVRLLGFVVEEVARINNLISEFLAFAKPCLLYTSWSGRSRSSRLRWSGWTPFWTRSPSPAGSWSSCGTAARKASPSAS